MTTPGSSPVLAPAVATALASGAPVVALESTLVAHGMPWPENLEVARALESMVREGGATPATIAVVGGIVHVGLDAATLEALARDGASFAKAGATDLAVHLARGSNAATTVSATAVLAARAGIKVFATGGIGGVHRGDSGDVSHDLIAMSRTPIAIVSAGAKAILDLPKTLELLETLGVLVIGYRTRTFPAFYSQSSGLPLDHSSDTPGGLAGICRAHWTSPTSSSVLVCNPIPSADALELGGAIDAAVAAAAAGGVTGKALTPFLLQHLATATVGASLRANRSLALHNAQVAAMLAVALARP